MDKTEVQGWLQHPLTKDLFDDLGAKIKELDSGWRPSLGEGMETIAIKTAQRVGNIEGIEWVLSYGDELREILNEE